MSLIQMNIKPTPPVKPLINVGCLMDIPTGSYVEGIHGESLLNGGIGVFTGIVGAGNLGKSTLAHYRDNIAAYRMGNNTTISIYDTELNLDEAKQLKFIQNITLEDPYQWVNNGRWIVSDPSVYSGDEWFDLFKEFMESKKNDKKLLIETPFKDRPDNDGKYNPMKMVTPTVTLLDSISNFQTKDITKMRDTNSLGDSGANMIAMTQNRHRDRVINETHYLSAASSTYTTMTGHIGEKIKIDPYAPDFKLLAGLKNNIKIKGVPPNFTFLTMSCWWVLGTADLVNSDKSVLYPKDDEDKSGNDKDLQLINLYLLRCKTGPSDIGVNIILSKREGILPTLSEFHYLRSNGYFGLIGSQQSFSCVFLPEEKLSRTTVRNKIDENKKLRRAINICSELLQIEKFYKGSIPNELRCLPEALYEDIKNLGYDWDFILEHTRGWWAPLGEHMDTLFLSTMDLLKMRKEQYHPYWLEKDKKTVKKEFAKHLKGNDK